MGCQTEIAAAIVAAKAHYVLAAKDNQPTLVEASDDNTLIALSIHNMLGNNALRRTYTSRLSGNMSTGSVGEGLADQGEHHPANGFGERWPCEHDRPEASRPRGAIRNRPASRRRWPTESLAPAARGRGYHPLVVSLANTGEVLSIVNRPGNRPSHEGAAEECGPIAC
jgi:hypothetical protein